MSSPGYQVIARKWRPQTFADVVGQDHVVRTLRNAIARQRIAHAYLFVGPRGTGKTSTARIFAKALNCTDGPNADFDVNDPACVSIAEGSHLDVIEIDGASNNGVDQVRDLRETVQYRPAQGKFKIYIIDEVHMLSAAAFNALLKTLEEPPPHVKFVFATTDPQKVLPTIVSRCQRFDLKPIPTDLIVLRLKKIADDEKIQVSDTALASIARMADGGMRDAQSIFDQMISFCGTEIGEADVLDVYGLVSGENVAALAGAMAAADHPKIIDIVDECDAAGRDLVRLLSDLQTVIRAALLDSIAQGGKTLKLGGVPMTTEQVTCMLDGLREGEGQVKLGLAEKINFEVTLLKAVQASRSRAIDTLIRELSELAAGDQKKKGLMPELEARLEKARLTRDQDRQAQILARPPIAPRVVEKRPAAEPAGDAVEDDAAPSALEERPVYASDSAPAPFDEEGPVWPDSSAEAAFLAEQGPVAVATPKAKAEIDTKIPLPALDALVARIPASTKAALEELFRARFVSVKRIQQDWLKE